MELYIQRTDGVVSETYNMVFRKEEVERFIKNLKNKKSCADGRIPNECDLRVGGGERDC